MSHYSASNYETLLGLDPEPFEKIAHLKRYPHIPLDASLGLDEPEIVSIPAVRRHLAQHDAIRLGAFVTEALGELDEGAVATLEVVSIPGVTLVKAEELKSLFVEYYPTTSPRQLKKLNFSVEKHIAKINAANDMVFAKLGSVGVCGVGVLPNRQQGKWFVSIDIEEGADRLSKERRSLMDSIIPTQGSRLVAAMNRRRQQHVSLLKSHCEDSAKKAATALQATEVSDTDIWIALEAAQPVQRNLELVGFAR